MLCTIRSHKWQETVSYYTEDIDWLGGEDGDWAAPGVGDRSGTLYDIYFDEMHSGCMGIFAVRDIRLHNT